MDCAWICLACALGPEGDEDDILSARIGEASNSGDREAIGCVKVDREVKEGMEDLQR